MAPLVDRCGRRIDYLRLSVTDRCDLRCAYCIPPGFDGFMPRQDALTPEEMGRLVRLFAQMGVRRLRLTGGEPLVRRDIVDVVERVAGIPGIEDLSLSTNGTRLAALAPALRAAGVRRLNISLDSLAPDQVNGICGRPVLRQVLEGIDAAVAAGFAPIKINMVVLRQNLDQLDAVVGYCMARGLVLRLIEVMPLGDAARTMDVVDLQPVRARLQQQFDMVDALVPGGGPARYLASRQGGFSVGFITPLSQHFCETCNRVRVTVDGVLHLCLGQEDRLPLRPLLRGGLADEEITQHIRDAVNNKPARHDFHNTNHRLTRFMGATGG